MAQDQQNLDLAGLVKTLRYATLATQIMPFIYASLYLIALITSIFASEDVVRVLDSMLYVSPLVIVGFLVLSKLFRLCVWHKAACVLPAVPRVVSFIDYYVIELSEIAAFVNIVVFASMAVLLLISAYHVFFK